MTRLDRIEPFLNEATPGDRRDTTSPAAMVATLRGLVLGDALSPDSRARLTDWLVGLRVGDKAGGGGHNASNDIAVLWPPKRAPRVVSKYLSRSAAPTERRNAALAAVGRAIAQDIAV